MNKQYEDLIIIESYNDELSFFECYGLTECIAECKTAIEYNNEIKGILILKDKAGEHICNKSALWNDLTGYIDTLQNENELSDNQLYIVTYYKYNGEPLDQLIDYGINKQQIIDNVNNQRYLEGAYYFTLKQLKQLEEIIEEN